jgi:hypothetical protein
MTRVSEAKIATMAKLELDMTPRALMGKLKLETHSLLLGIGTSTALNNNTYSLSSHRRSQL